MESGESTGCVRGKFVISYSLIKGQNATWGYEKCCAESIEKESPNRQIMDFPHHLLSSGEQHLKSSIRGQPWYRI